MLTFYFNLLFAFARVDTSQLYVGLVLSQALVMRCWSDGTSHLKRAAVFPSCLGDVGATGITLAQRNTVWLSAAARVSPRTRAVRSFKCPWYKPDSCPQAAADCLCVSQSLSLSSLLVSDCS